MQWLIQARIKVLEWSSQSPELKSMRTCGHAEDTRLSQKANKLTKLHQLYQDDVKDLTRSMLMATKSA